MTLLLRKYHLISTYELQNIHLFKCNTFKNKQKIGFIFKPKPESYRETLVIFLLFSKINPSYQMKNFIKFKHLYLNSFFYYLLSVGHFLCYKSTSLLLNANILYMNTVVVYCPEKG